MYARHIIGFSLLCTATIACALSLPEPTPPSLYKYITTSDPYTKWSLLPGSEKQHIDAAQSHDTHLTTRVNSIAFNAIIATQPIRFSPSKPLSLPPGSIIVKQNYGDGLDKPPSLQVMYKVPLDGPSCGYPECESGWFFTYYAPGETTPDPAPVQHCIACHTGITTAATKPPNPAVESATYMLSLSDNVWGLFYQMVHADKPD